MVSSFVAKKLPKCNPFALNLCYDLHVLVSWSLCVKFFSLCVFASLRLCVEFFAFVLYFRRLASAYPLKQHWQFSRGGVLPHTRCIGVISAASAELLAAQKCQFIGLLPCSRLSFRRKYCKLCNKCSYNCNIHHNFDYLVSMNRHFHVELGCAKIPPGF